MSADISTSAVPNPGSDEAVMQGCKCARLDNARGRGYMGMPGIFVYTEGCPLHWPQGTDLPSAPKGGRDNG
jgi:hypothetical protein